jgi:poly(A) polymerase/tRNA nucleotidyltransferase (CCA-adding enzyme)
MVYKIPKEVLNVLMKIEEAGFEAYLVGGCVRDLLMSREPKDWDITTNASPEAIQSVFPDSFYENDFGTVGVKTGSENPAVGVVEVTPYRLEAKYSDKRHPDVVIFAKTLKEDLKRRDFTINSLALKVSHTAYTFVVGSAQTGEVDDHMVEFVDEFDGRKDLADGIVRTVGDPKERLNEDTLRILRAVRFAAEFGFRIEKSTEDALTSEAHLLRMVSKERIRDEFNKIIMADGAESGIINLHKFGILRYIVPEIEEGVGMGQNKEHVYTVWDHSVKSLKHAAAKKFPLEVRLAAFFHDIGKPRTKEGEGHDSTFYNHELVGARMTAQIMTRLKYPKKIAEKVVKLVRWHLFFSDTEVITLSAVRRIVRNVGPENVWDLMNVRFCDRIGMGRPKEEPYRLRKYEAMIEEAMRDPLTVGMLKVDGKRVMEVAGVEPGPKVGFILHALLEEVLDDPKLNSAEYLEKRVAELVKLPDNELERLGTEGKSRKDSEENKEIMKIRGKYRVE